MMTEFSFLGGLVPLSVGSGTFILTALIADTL